MSSFAPIAPATYVPPTLVGKDTYVIHQVQEALGEPLFVYLNSMVILGKEPMGSIGLVLYAKQGLALPQRTWFEVDWPRAGRWSRVAEQDHAPAAAAPQTGDQVGGEAGA